MTNNKWAYRPKSEVKEEVKMSSIRLNKLTCSFDEIFIVEVIISKDFCNAPA